MTQKKKQKKNNEKHVPMRTCIACRARRPKQEMVRFVLENGKKPVIDQDGKFHGRGASLCPDIACMDAAIEKRAFSRSWKTRIEESSWDQVRKDLEAILKNKEFRGGKKNITYRASKEQAEKLAGSPVTRGPV